jgi:NAD(P)-dependent dehydrogenase (short-subunit alcohol dehydrogenase family)
VTTPARSQLPVAVVTGGNRGVGLEICRQLAMARYAVVLGSREPRKAELAAKEIDPEGERITPCHIEVDNSVNIQQLTGWVKDRYGRVDTLVNNASAPPDLWAIAGTTDLTPVAEALDINLFGAWRVTQALLPLLRKSPRPRIVNVSSEGGSIALMNGGRPAYSVSKAALNALTKLLAGELYRDGILVNAVCPGWMPNDGSGPGGRSRTFAQGAASVVWAATLPDGGPTGTFTRDGRALPWLCGPERPGDQGEGDHAHSLLRVVGAMRERDQAGRSDLPDPEAVPPRRLRQRAGDPVQRPGADGGDEAGDDRRQRGRDDDLGRQAVPEQHEHGVVFHNGDAKCLLVSSEEVSDGPAVKHLANGRRRTAQAAGTGIPCRAR